MISLHFLSVSLVLRLYKIGFNKKEFDIIFSIVSLFSNYLKVEEQIKVKITIIF